MYEPVGAPTSFITRTLACGCYAATWMVLRTSRRAASPWMTAITQGPMVGGAEHPEDFDAACYGDDLLDAVLAGVLQGDLLYCFGSSNCTQV